MSEATTSLEPGTLEQAWEAYHAAAHPNGLPRRQHLKRRRAFYAGARAMLRRLQRVADLMDADGVLRQTVAWEHELDLAQNQPRRRGDTEIPR